MQVEDSAAPGPVQAVLPIDALLFARALAGDAAAGQALSTIDELQALVHARELAILEISCVLVWLSRGTITADEAVLEIAQLLEEGRDARRGSA
jgi:hypothetical protein